MKKHNYISITIILLIVIVLQPNTVLNTSSDKKIEQTERATYGWHDLPDTAGYHDYYETIDFINSIILNYPDITFLNASIGLSIEGKSIPALKISDNPEIDEDEPEALYFAQMHAREVIALENCLGLIEYLCSGYGNNVDITELVNNRELWFIPILNPDGAQYCADQDYAWRKNRRNNGDGTFGVDLNRNFGFEWGHDFGSSGSTSAETYRGTAPFSEPESQALRDFVLIHNFSVSMSMHSYSALWLWPWDFSSEPTPDDLIFSEIGRKLAEYQKYYRYEPMSGDELYLVSGDTDDWFYGVKDIFAFTVEIYSGRYGNIFWNFNPPDYNIQYEVENNLDSFMYLAEIADNPQRAITQPISKIIAPLDGRTVSGSVETIILAMSVEKIKNVYFQVDDANWIDITTFKVSNYEWRYMWPSGAFQAGDHSIRAKFEDISGNTGKSTRVYITINSIEDTTVPIISSPNDLVINQSDIEQFVTWNISDNYPYYAELYINDSLVNNYIAYTNNTPVIAPINSTMAGVWNYTLIAYDQQGNKISDTVYVTINEINPLTSASTTSETPNSTSKLDTSGITTENEDTHSFDSIFFFISLTSISIIIKRRKKREI